MPAPSTGPQVSVVMTVRNGSPYLRAAVESVLGQTWTDYEFLIVDDGSTDDTWETLSRYATQDQRIRLWRNPTNRGIVRSMNNLFAEARGEYVTRHDADDISLPQRLERQVSYLDAHPEIGVLASQVQVINAAGQRVAGQLFAHVPLTHTDITRQLLNRNCLCQGSVMIRRVCRERVGQYDPTTEPTEDYDLWLRLGEITQLAALDEVLYQYRIHGDSISHSSFPVQIWQAAVVLERAVFRRFGAHPPAARLEPVAQRYLEAAVANWQVGETNRARDCLAQSQRHCPDLLEWDEPVTSMLLEWSKAQPAEDGADFVRRLFDSLWPGGRKRSRLKTRLISKIYMRDVFAANRSADPARVRKNLMRGISHDPRWLLNRGVLSLLASVSAGRGRGRGRPADEAGQQQQPGARDILK